jgi:hypothetical protein
LRRRAGARGRVPRSVGESTCPAPKVRPHQDQQRMVRAEAGGCRPAIGDRGQPRSLPGLADPG